MKKTLLFLILLNQLIIAQNSEINSDFARTTITIKNEFNIPYPNTRILIKGSTKNYTFISDIQGNGIIDLKKGEEFRVSCFVNGEEFKFDEVIYIEKNKNIISANIDLQFDLYESIFEIKNLNFKTAKYNIEEKYFQELDNLKSLLVNENEIKIEIAGHTDNNGSELANQLLSENRAKSVKSYLVKNGIDKLRINCVGYGEKQPIADNNSKQGREKNRRIEIRILK
ncbi:MAG: OmpA family protein [Flavobacteriaceae bacterium]|nr:OmpA family protein [Flavobacteriaceae bacterium]